jgi:hypothetical protein
VLEQQCPSGVAPFAEEVREAAAREAQPEAVVSASAGDRRCPIAEIMTSHVVNMLLTIVIGHACAGQAPEKWPYMPTAVISAGSSVRTRNQIWICL